MIAGTDRSNCERCLKAADLCVCASVRPIETRLEILILQHPQEPDHELGTARLASLALPRATLKVGLSWRNLAHALGKEAAPGSWAVLYLGSGIKRAPGQPTPTPGLHFVTQNGGLTEAPAHLRGIVILDGTWSQAKTLWWRNAWLLKLRRAILVPQRKSLYGELRREPRRECLSTIETIAEALESLGEPAATGGALRALFAELLARKRAKHPHRRRPGQRR